MEKPKNELIRQESALNFMQISGRMSVFSGGGMKTCKTLNKFLLMSVFVLVGCSNQYNECIEKQMTEYRNEHPNSPYSEAQSKYAVFEMMCSSKKGK